jgi:hypothetical protein
MRFRVLDAGTPDGLAEWIERWRRWPAREVMAHPGYARLFARPCDRVVAALGEDEGGSTLFPLVLRPLAVEHWTLSGEGRWDAVTPYGYGGPFSWGPGPRDHGAFWREHAAWALETRLVSTFARLSLFGEHLAPTPGRVEVVATNFVVPLEGGTAAVWRGYEQKVRRWVRRAEAGGCEVEVDRDGRRLDAFLAIYTHTMLRRGAADWYFFPRSFFEAIIDGLRGQFAFFFTVSRGEPISADLVLCSAEHVTFFLGGTLAHTFPLGANYLLKHRVAEWAIAEGKRWYVLGGGHEGEDGLFRYKRAFARRGGVPFRVACLVHDERGYHELVRARAAFAERTGAAWAPRSGFFPSYRG